MEAVVKTIQDGFVNCIFFDKNPDVVKETMMRKMQEAKDKVGIVEVPDAIRVTNIDELHDKLSLAYGNKTIEGEVTWRKATNGAHYVMSAFKVAS